MLIVYYGVQKTRSQLQIFISFPIERIIIPCSYCASFSHLTFYTSTNSNLYLNYSFAAALRDPALYTTLILEVPVLIPFFPAAQCSPGNPAPRRSEWWNTLPPNFFVARAIISNVNVS